MHYGNNIFIIHMKKAISILSVVCLVTFIISTDGFAQKKSGPAGKKGKSAPVDTLAAKRILKIEPFRLEILPPASGVQFYKYGIVFLADSKTEGKMLKSHTSFGNVETYYAAFQDSLLGRHELFSRQASFGVPCDGMTFNRDFTEMYFTKRQGKNDPEKIYMANYKATRENNREWAPDDKPLPFCTGRYTYTHPALSAGGDTMVFASNRPESFGEFDLFVTYRNEDAWSDPENIGNRINSSRDELFPFLDAGNNLYFSSNGHRGLGGYDLFVCRYNGNGWDEPLNLTKEINSPNDEIALTIDRSDSKTAFYTSRLQLGKQTLKLYRVTLGSQYALSNYQTLPVALEYLARTEGLPGEQGVQVASVPGQVFKTTREPVKVTEVPGAESSRKQVTQPVSQATAQIKSTKKETADTARVVALVRDQETKKAANPPQQQAAQEETKKQPALKPAAATTVTQANAPSETNKPGSVVYRVQFSSSKTSKGSFEITFGGISYKTFEYSYNGLFRSCVGEFSSAEQAKALQKIVKKEGFPDAFVAAFKDNVRSLDPSLFK
jgi:hypothetical protein